MTLREVLCQALNTGARGEGGCSTPSITRGNEIRPTPGASHATDNVIRGNEIRPTPGAMHATQPAPNTPRRGTHASMHLVRHTNPTMLTENCGDKPFRTCPAVRASRVPTQSQHKASEKLAKLARRQISRSALRRASRLPSRSRRSYGQTRSDRTERC